MLSDDCARARTSSTVSASDWNIWNVWIQCKSFLAIFHKQRRKKINQIHDSCVVNEPNNICRNCRSSVPMDHHFNSKSWTARFRTIMIPSRRPWTITVTTCWFRMATTSAWISAIMLKRLLLKSFHLFANRNCREPIHFKQLSDLNDSVARMDDKATRV